MAARDKLPAKIQQAIDQIGVEVGGQVTSEQTDALGKLHDIQERGRHNRTIIHAWKQQQDQDRRMRKTYATWLMVILTGQVIAVNVVFILMGCGLLKLEQWTANTFIMAVFAEISTLVLLVVRYLFPATSDKVLELIDRFRVEEKPR